MAGAIGVTPYSGSMEAGTGIFTFTFAALSKRAKLV